MSDDASSPGPVKGFYRPKGWNPLGKNPIRKRRPGRKERGFKDKRTSFLLIRFLRYVRNAFAKGAPYLIARKLLGSFSRTTGFSEKHLRERLFPTFRRSCSEFKFERVNRGRTREYRITPNVETTGGLRAGEIRARLVGAVRRMVELSGRCHCDREFLRKFSTHAKLPLELIEAAWRGIKNLPGFEVTWQGSGRGVKFVARPARPVAENFQTSDPQTSGGLSSPTGRRYEKTADFAAGPGSDRAGAVPPSPQPSVAEGVTSNRGGSSPPEGTSDPSIRLKHRPRCPLPARYAAIAPRQFCGRWISPRKLFAKALWLGCGPLRKIHVKFARVAWRRAHAVNFAFESLFFGYTENQICAAWEIGVERSHEDASDRDRLPGGGYASQREPSAAKVYAIAAIKAADGRPAEDRWAEFFARGDAARTAGAAPRAGTGAERSTTAAPETARRDPRPRGTWTAGSAGVGEGARFSAAEAAERLAALRLVVKQRPAAPAGIEGARVLTAGELKAECDARGLTLANFNGLPWSTKEAIVAAAVRRRASSRTADGDDVTRSVD